MGVGLWFRFGLWFGFGFGLGFWFGFWFGLRLIRFFVFFWPACRVVTVDCAVQGAITAGFIRVDGYFRIFLESS